jgi:hypothetical protein
MIERDEKRREGKIEIREITSRLESQRKLIRQKYHPLSVPHPSEPSDGPD